MAETYVHQPHNPVDFLAKWLLNYNKAAIQEDKMKEEYKLAEEKKEAFKKEQEQVVAEQDKHHKLSEEKHKKIEDFYKKFQGSDDLEDHLQELSDFISVSFYLF